MQLQLIARGRKVELRGSSSNLISALIPTHAIVDNLPVKRKLPACTCEPGPGATLQLARVALGHKSDALSAHGYHGFDPDTAPESPSAALQVVQDGHEVFGTADSLTRRFVCAVVFEQQVIKGGD
jgi:hypothetical protein